MTEEVATLDSGLEELLVLISREGEVAINFAAVEAEVKNPAGCNVCRGSQELGFDWLPVQTFRVIRDCAHDSGVGRFIEAVEVSCRHLRRRRGRKQIPRQQFRDPVDGMIGNAPQHRTQVLLRIDPVQLGRPQ